jgi:hypothetical protein
MRVRTRAEQFAQLEASGWTVVTESVWQRMFAAWRARQERRRFP